MTIYDKIGKDYDAHRGHVGARQILEQVRELGTDLHALDLGCGTGHPIAVEVAPHVERYLGIDNSAAMLSAFKENVPGVECRLLDLMDVQSVGGAWDLIFSWGVIFHLRVEEQAVALVESGKLLKPGGRLLFNSGQDAGCTTGKVGDHRVEHYSMSAVEYRDLLVESGLEIISADMGELENFIYLFERPHTPQTAAH